MTIEEAEKLYQSEVIDCCAQHKKETEKNIMLVNCICPAIMVIGIILLIISFATPLETNSWGEELSIGAFLERLYGSMLLGICGLLLIALNIRFYISLKKGPKNFLQPIKNLYMNYLKCDDMNKDHKDFYIQKLEDIRNAELVNAVHSAAVSVSSAVMFSALYRK